MHRRSEILECLNRHWHTALLMIVSLLFLLRHPSDVPVEKLIFPYLPIHLKAFLFLQKRLKPQLRLCSILLPLFTDHLDLAVQLHVTLVNLRIFPHLLPSLH